MVETSKLKGADFQQNFGELEVQFVDEIEDIISSQLYQRGYLNPNHGSTDNLEFFGKTNFKIRLKLPNKNVWSVPIQLLKRSIQRVLRNGGDIESLSLLDKKGNLSDYELPIKLLLKSIPQEEFSKRTFVGNAVCHDVYGEGEIKSINETGNVEVSFKDRQILLKPEFCKLKTR
jgi:hypothetical protein